MNLNEAFDINFNLETERLIIKIIDIKYVDDYIEYYSGKNMCKYLDWNGPEDREEAIKYFLMWREEYNKGYILPFAIIDKTSNKMIGSIIFSEFMIHRIDMGYELGELYWHKGIMNEALSEIIPLIFRKLLVKRIQCIVFDGNIASEKLLAKLGFINEGILRKYSYHFAKNIAIDSNIFALLK